MKNDITELVFILDCSGSMAGLERDTIGGFNAMLAKQKAQAGRCYVSTVLFDHDTKVIHDRQPLERVKPMTAEDYTVGGSTALLDAVGGAIRHIRNIHRYIRPEDVPARTLFVITTDGMENSSHRYTAAQVKQMIGSEKELHGWEFLFLGANIDAVETAATIGIDADRAVNYNCDSEGTALNFETVGNAVSALRCSAPLASSWKTAIEKDHAARKARR